MRNIAIAVIIFILAVTGAADAAITGIGTGLVQNASQTGTASITVPEDCTFVLVGIAGDGNAGDYAPTTLTINDVSLTEIYRMGNSGYAITWLYYLSDPDTGSQTFAWAWPSAMSEGVNYLFVYLKGVDSLDPIGDYDRADGANIVLDTVAGSVVYGLVSNYDGVGDVSPDGSDQEDILVLEAPYNSDWAGFGKEPATGDSVTFSYTAASYGTCIAVALNEARAPTVFYLSDSDGDDAYNGLFPSFVSGTDGPFKTLSKSESVLRAGDTLLIRGGTYTGASIVVNFDADGTEELPITIDNYDGESVIIDAADTYPAGSVYYFVVTLSGDYITIRDIAINNSRGSGLLLSGSYCNAVNITGDTSREAGILASGTGDIVDGCTWVGCGSGYGIDGQTTWGSAIGTNGVNCTIRNCLVYDNVGEGLNAGGASASGNTIEDCISYNNDSVNLYIDSSHGSLVQRNLIYDTTETPASGITIGAEVRQPEGATIINNIVMGCFMNLHVDGNVTALTDVVIEHNTFVDAKGNGEGYNMGVYIRASVESFSDSVFKNNIVIESVAGREPISVAASHDGLVFSNNAWNKAAVEGAQGAGDVTGDPLLTASGPTTAGNLTGDYFRLQAGSSCINAGANLGVTSDYFRSTRPLGSGYDIGACEFRALDGLIMRVLREVFRVVQPSLVK